MRYFWLLLILFCSSQTQACWQAQELESMLLQQLAEFRQTWRSGCRRGDGNRYCDLEIKSAERAYNALPQNKGAESVKSLREIDETCGNRKMDIYEAQAETLEEILSNQPSVTINPLGSTPESVYEQTAPPDEIRHEIIANVIDPCYTKVAKAVLLPEFMSIKYAVETMKNLQAAGIDGLVRNIRPLLRSDMSRPQRTQVYKASRDVCEKASIDPMKSAFRTQQ